MGWLKYNATLASFLTSCWMKIHFRKRATVALSERSGKCSHQQKESSWLDASFIRSLQTVAELISTHFYATAKCSNLLYKNDKGRRRCSNSLLLSASLSHLFYIPELNVWLSSKQIGIGVFIQRQQTLYILWPNYKLRFLTW